MVRDASLAVLLVLLPVAALAQPVPQPSSQNVVTLRPAEKDTVGCRWERTMLNGTVNVRRIGSPAQVDANPNAIVTAGPTASGNLVSVQLYPNQGCVLTGCRKGNSYQVDITGTDDQGNSPMCAIKLIVKETSF